jgi:hypothetical protein
MLMIVPRQLLQNNGEDLKDLIEKLEPQQQFIESEISYQSRNSAGQNMHRTSLSHSGDTSCSPTSCMKYLC